MADPLIGTDEELNAVRAFLSTSRDGPALVLLEGEAGIGKTSVWEAIIAAEGPGRQLLRARPAEAEMESLANSSRAGWTRSFHAPHPGELFGASGWCYDVLHE